jgi:RimJ/RimL family protein N-acetyltransferase
MDPLIRKAGKVIGKTLVFRNAEVGDAEFILSLRLDEKKSRHLSSTKPELDVQVKWLESYRNGSGQAYFIIEEANGAPIGTVRLYDAQADSFCWGSWIIKDGVAPRYAIESALMVYRYALEELGFTRAHFDVRKENTSVWSFHERFGAVRTNETELDYFYALPNDAIRVSLAKYEKYLPGIRCEA